MSDTLQARIERALLTVINRRTGLDVVRGEQVRDVATTTEGRVQLVLELAAADDPTLARDVRQAVEAVGGVVDCRVNVQAVKAAPAPPPPVAATGRALPVMHEPAAAQRAAPAPTPAAFPSLGKIIAVSSGKGGVGKSTVTVNQIGRAHV